MLALPVHYDREARFAKLFAPGPDLFYERAGRVVAVRIDVDRLEGVLDFHRRPESGYDDNIVRTQFGPGNDLLAIRRKNEPNAAIFKIGVDIGIVDHLAEEENTPVRMGI